jgi:hypothetical protein
MKMLLNLELKSQIYSLKLSNKQTCVQIKTFLLLFSFKEFSNLRSLTIIKLKRDDAVQLKSILLSIPEVRCLHLIDSDVHSFIKPSSKLRTLSLPFLRYPMAMPSSSTLWCH